MVAMGWQEDWNWDRDGYFICQLTAFFVVVSVRRSRVSVCVCVCGKQVKVVFFVLFYGLLFVLGVSFIFRCSLSVGILCI